MEASNIKVNVFWKVFEKLVFCPSPPREVKLLQVINHSSATIPTHFNQCRLSNSYIVLILKLEFRPAYISFFHHNGPDCIEFQIWQLWISLHVINQLIFQFQRNVSEKYRYKIARLFSSQRRKGPPSEDAEIPANMLLNFMTINFFSPIFASKVRLWE